MIADVLRFTYATEKFISIQQIQIMASVAGTSSSPWSLKGHLQALCGYHECPGKETTSQVHFLSCIFIMSITFVKNFNIFLLDWCIAYRVSKDKKLEEPNTNRVYIRKTFQVEFPRGLFMHQHTLVREGSCLLFFLPGSGEIYQDLSRWRTSASCLGNSSYKSSGLTPAKHTHWWDYNAPFLLKLNSCVILINIFLLT